MKVKKIHLKRTVSFLTASALLIAMAPCENIMAEEQEETKAYIVFTEDQESYAEAADQIGEEAIAENETLEDNNVILADLTESEAELLDKESGVLFVEEDFEMEANGFEEADWEENPPLSREEVTALKMEMREERNVLNEREYVDPEDYEWNMKAVDANEADTGDPAKIKVAVLDSGVDNVMGIELADSVNLVPEEADISPLFLDMSGHGTGIASIIAGNAQNEVQGVNPNAALYSVKVLDAMNKAPVSRIIEGIYWCIDNGMQVINMSFGTPRYSEALKNAVEEAYAAGILMVGAAGNGAGDVEYPAAFPQVMAVAATGANAQITDFSNTGEELEIAAPGEQVKATSFFGGSTVTAGTSISAPHVTGAASLLWQKDPSKSNEFIRQLLSYSAKDIANGDGCGLLDVGYALEIYDAFAENFDGTAVNEEQLPENTKEPETFEYINDDENYVEGRWSAFRHKALVDDGFTGNNQSITSEKCKIMKVGAIYPDGIAELGTKHMEGWHGKSGTNYVAVYELITRIALKSGNTTTFTNWQSIPGMTGQGRYESIKSVFVMKNGEPYQVGKSEAGYKTWKQIFQYVDKVYGTTVGANYGKDASADAKNRKYFIWGMAMHFIGDMFAHDMYRKSDNKEIIHGSTAASGTIIGADDIKVVKRRGDAAQRAIKSIVESALGNIYGNWMEIDDGLKAPEYADNKMNFRKSKLYTYMVQSGADKPAQTRAKAASIKD